MEPLIKEINQDFKEILAKYDTPEHPAKELLDEVNRKFVEAGCYLWPKKLFPIFLKPVFITKKRINYVSYVTNTLMSALEKVSDLYFKAPELRDLFQLKPEEIMLCEIDPGYPTKIRITRNDAFMGDDYFKFVEFNTDSPGGPMYSDQQNRILSDTPVMQELKKKWKLHTDYFIPQVLETLLSAYRDFGGKKEKPFICIASTEGGSTVPEFLLIVEWFKEHGYGSVFNDVRKLQYDGKYLRTEQGDIIDIIYRRGWLPDWTDNIPEIQPLLKAYREGKVCVVNSPRSILASNKSIMELIQREDIQKIFTPEEQKCIRENIPWTRLMKEGKTTFQGKEIDLYEFVAKNREKLVLKPIDMYGGIDVCVGKDASQQKWEEFINKTFERKFVVQEYVPIPEEEFPVIEERVVWKPKKINVNFYAYNLKYAGGITRTSEASVINISAGGGLAVIQVVEGKK